MRSPGPPAEGIRDSEPEAPLGALLHDPRFSPQIVSWRALPATPALTEEPPAGLHPALVDALQSRGITALYAHQAEATRQALAGHHLVIVTPTASGKTLCYQLPMLDSLLRQPESRALYLFPTKALAHDQQQRLAADLATMGMDAGLAATFDGDTPPGERQIVRERARILITNPDMLHVGILPNHVRWREWLAALRYVVIDEMHTYRGVFGSQVAHVLQRLRRLCRFYGSDPRFICTSATIANPRELAVALIGEPAVLVDRSGAPEPPRQMVLYNPPIVDRRLGIRRPALEDARQLALFLIQRGQQTVCFTRSRLAVERMVIALRLSVADLGLAPQTIRGYRAGYLSNERRTIESQLRDGTVRCVVATSALELGIDIGSLAACVLVGYPGSTASMWQRAGRVGRGKSAGVTVLVAADTPLDQYLLAHPEHLLGAAPVAARVNPQNLHVRVAQTRSALYELPMDAHDTSADPTLLSILQALEAQQEVRHSNQRWYWASQAFPAVEVSLRTAESARVTIVAGSDGRNPEVVGQVEASAAPRWVHPNAVYLHEGNQYLVHSLDLEAGVAASEAVDLPYITVASERTEVQVERLDGSQAEGDMVTSHGEIRLTSQVTSFRREHIETHQVLSREALDMPEQVFFTSACWLGIQPSLVERLDKQGLWSASRGAARGPNWDLQRALARERDGRRCRHCGAEELQGRAHDVHHVVPFHAFGWVAGENDLYRQANRLENLLTLCPRCHQLAERQIAVASTLSDLGHLLRYLIPLWILCDPGDIGTHTDSAGQRADMPTLFVYDRTPGGAGISGTLPPLIRPLLRGAGERVDACPCEGGCPSCIGPGLRPQPVRKRAVVELLTELLH